MGDPDPGDCDGVAQQAIQVQIGSTPNLSLCSSMQAVTCAGGR
jgi:hypothetical protein